MAFGWDVDDDDVEDGDEVDNAHPYGADPNLNHDDSQEMADGQNAEGKGKQKDAAEQQEEEKQQNEKWWQIWKKRKENAPDSPKMMKRTAKQEGMPTKIERWSCPRCHKKSLLPIDLHLVEKYEFFCYHIDMERLNQIQTYLEYAYL